MLYIIAIAGSTNISRQGTAFVSYWKVDGDGIKKFNDIIIESTIKKGTLFENMYYVELFDSESHMQINTSTEGFITITNDKVTISSNFIDGVIYIQEY